MLEPGLERCMKVGVISDTHGLLRAEALAALQGCEPVSYTHLTLPTILLV